MMRACLGENVTPEYAPLMREKWDSLRAMCAGQSNGERAIAAAARPDRRAGVCAIALGVALGRLGIPTPLSRRTTNSAGTWYVNRYPGCGVDTPNHSYSFSFGARNNWTVISRSAKNCWTISRRSRSNMTFAATSASTPD